ncbi:MAG: glycosyltransferase family 39 protein [Anaerolineae bacterium]
MVLRRSLLTLLLVLITFLPRALDLGRFLVHDEAYINNWTRRSMAAIAEGDWGRVMGSTSGAGNLVWARTAARALQYFWLQLQGQPVTFAEVMNNPPEYDPLPGAVLCALGVLAVYPFARAAFGHRIAYLAVALLALDPFLLSESRVIRMEGAYSVFMVLSLVSLAAYTRTSWRRYLVWTGVWFAWAAISKISAISLLPLTLLVTISSAWRPASATGNARRFWDVMRRGLIDFLIVFGVGLLGFVVLWPRLWADPVGGIQDLYTLLRLLIAEGKHMDFFFMGKLWYTTLPATYYPVVIAFKTTPFVWLGLLCLVYELIAWLRARRRIPVTVTPDKASQALSGQDSWCGVLILAGFAACYTGGMALGSFKQERYMISVVAALDVAAAAGVVWTVQRVWGTAQRSFSRSHALIPAAVIAALFLVGHAVPSVLSHPYYYSYYNPLLGGAPMAYRAVQIGSGEGIDLAMHHLNQLPNPERQRVVCGTNKVRCEYASAGQEILKQETLNYTNAAWVSADYVVTYVFQQQRGDYEPGLLDYLARHTGVEKVVNLGGQNFAVVYRAPRAQHVAASHLPGVATLLGYTVENIHIPQGGQLRVKLYLRSDGFADQQIYVRLDDADGRVWAHSIARILPGFDNVAMRGTIFEAEAVVEVPNTMPGGLYFMKMGILSADGNVHIGMFKLPSDGDDIVIEASPET